MTNAQHEPEEPQSLDNELQKLEQIFIDTFGSQPQTFSQLPDSEAEEMAAIEQEFDELGDWLGNLTEEQATRMEHQQALRELVRILEEALQIVKALQKDQSQSGEDQGTKSRTRHLQELVDEIRSLLDRL
jgi:hypothetical protein